MERHAEDGASEKAVCRRRGRSVIRAALKAGLEALDETEAKRLLRAYGIRVPAGAAVSSAEQAGEAAELLGPRVVLKALGPDVQHKSDRGLVAVDVRGDTAARVAFHRIVELGAGRAERVLVEEMVPHERELLVGMKRDRRFGPVVAFGIGGVFTEALRDVGFALAPLDDQDAADLIAQLRAQRLLGALRGLPRVNGAELRRIVTAVGRMALDHPEIAEIDVNPLAVAGGSLVALDALVVLGKVAGEEAAPRHRIARRCGSPGGDAGAARIPSLEAVFAPRSVAVVGASADEGKWGGSLLRNIVAGGYRGRVYPVNPRGDPILGLQTFASVDDLPERPDLCLVALAAELSVSVVTRCAALGVPAAVVIAAGFSEAGPAGRRLEGDLVEAADDRIALLGPNCMGLFCNSSSLHAVGYVTLQPPQGTVSVISQSGNIGTQLLMSAEGRGIGIEKYVGVGNQAQTTAADVLDYLADDPGTQVIIAYVEEMEDGRRFFEVARRATAKKPVVLMHGGATTAGSRAAASHTGAMAGSAEVLAAAMRQAGVIVTTDPDESLDLAACLAHLPLPGGRRVGVVTLGGGWGVLTADELVRNGLELASLPTDLVRELDALLPPYWSRDNPVDLVASADGDLPARVLELVACSPAVDAVIALALVGSPSSGRTSRRCVHGGVDAGPSRVEPESPAEAGRPGFAAAPDEVGSAAASSGGPGLLELNAAERALLARAAVLMGRTGKPILSVSLVPVARAVHPELGAVAPVVLGSPSAAVRALARMRWHAERRRR